MKRKISIGQIITIIGTLIFCAGMLGYGFGIISNTVFRTIVAIGFIIQVVALIFILKKGEF